MQQKRREEVIAQVTKRFTTDTRVKSSIPLPASSAILKITLMSRFIYYRGFRRPICVL